MNNLTLEIDAWDHEELKDYLLSINGIDKVEINEKENILINITYNHNKINMEILRMEIELFLNLNKIPYLLSFDKHTQEKTKEYNITVNNLCCEYCLKGMIKELFLTKGIEKSFSDFYKSINENNNKVIITTFYNPKIISKLQMKQIEQQFNK